LGLEAGRCYNDIKHHWIQGKTKMRKNFPILAGIALSVLILRVGLSAAQEDAGPGNGVVVKQVERFYYCCLTQAGDREAVPRAIKLVWQLMEDQVIAPTGPAIGVFYNSPERTSPEVLMWDIGFPITPQTRVLAPLTLKRWTHTLVAEAYHYGPLNRAGETYERILEWMEANGYDQDGPVLEMYFTDPTEENPAEYKTRIWVPCAPKGPQPDRTRG
jgi:DNA gyrase inhibitor GyrI